VLFGAVSAEQVTVNTGSDIRYAKSLWFDAGTFYTLTGTRYLELQSTTHDGKSNIIAVHSTGSRQSEHNIEVDLRLKSDGYIRNYSEGGLRLGGLIGSGDRKLYIEGTGAIHFAGRFGSDSGNTDPNANFNTQIEVKGDASAGTQPHFILSGYNPKWSGNFRVEDRGFAIVKRDQALGFGSEKHARNGGTMAFRSHLETPLTHGVAQGDANNYLQVWGEGIVRREGTQKIGSLYNDGGMNTFDWRITLHKENDNIIYAGVGSRGDREGGLTLTNSINGTGIFLKLGPGLVVLANKNHADNNWEFGTHLRAGVLRLSEQTSKNLSKVNLVFDGGVHGGILELGHSDFARDLGTVNNQMRWTGDGGFSAHGGNRSVTIHGGAALTWDSTAHFLGDGHALLLSSRYADSIITLTNAINLNGAQREVRVERGDFHKTTKLAAHGVLSGELSGTGGLLKTGRGLLHLTYQGDNEYTGATRIADGALRGKLGKNSNIILSGGVLGLDSKHPAVTVASNSWLDGIITLDLEYKPTLGTSGSAQEIRWEGHGGFAAYEGKNILVTLFGNPDPWPHTIWGQTAHFLGANDELRFGHYTADGLILWNNKIRLDTVEQPGGVRTIRVERSEANKANDRADVRFTKTLTSTKDVELNIVGDGRIEFSDDNSELLAKHIRIYGAELIMHGDGNIATISHHPNPAQYDLRYGGTLTLDSNRKSAMDDRVHNESPITLAAGNLNLISRGGWTGGGQAHEKIGNLIVELGANSVGITGFEYGKAILHIEGLVRADSSRGTLDITFGDNSRFQVPDADTSVSGHTVGGIIPWATSGGSGWVTNGSEWSQRYIVELASSSYTGWSGSSNVKTSSTVSLGSARTINSLVLGGNLGLGGHSLTLDSGGLLVTGGNRTISGSGSITTGGIRPLYVHTSGNLTFSDTARLTGGMDVVKTLGGTLRFNNSASNTTHTIGDLYIHQGTVEVGRNSRLSVRDRVTIGDGAGTDRLILPGGVWYPIVKEGGGLPSITLRGTPYDPRGPESNSAATAVATAKPTARARSSSSTNCASKTAARSTFAAARSASPTSSGSTT